MNNENFDRKRIIELLRKNLRENFPLYEESHAVESRDLGDGKIWVGYSAGGFTPTGREGTHFDLNIEGDICYALYIHLEKSKRGAGFGWALYEAVHGFAENFGCRAVRCYPSGSFFIKGKIIKSRRQYLLEKGYQEVEYGGEMSELELGL